MNNSICSGLLAALATAFTWGCAVDLAPVGAAEEELTIPNALIPNALIPNALIPNALIPNSLAPNALDPDALDPDALAAIQDPGPTGNLSRLLIRYAVGCALEPTQSFAFSWTDTGGVVHAESYQGSLGIAVEWASGALLDLDRQELVSACLAGRANYYGIPVLLSMRSPRHPLEDTSAAELAAFPAVEGAFWGNLFSASPHLYACYDAADVAHSRAALRACATGYLASDGSVLPCGPIVLTGDCASVCADRGGLAYYPSCTSPNGAATSGVITTALP